jgi:hypothetical protein
MSLIREKSPRLWNAEGPKNTIRELVAEKQLKYSECKVAHHAADTHGLAILLPSIKWSTIQRVRVTIQRVQATWRFTFPPAALYKQTGRCEVTTSFIVTTVVLLKNLTIAEAFSLHSRAKHHLDLASAKERASAKL